MRFQFSNFNLLAAVIVVQSFVREDNEMVTIIMNQRVRIERDFYLVPGINWPMIALCISGVTLFSGALLQAPFATPQSIFA